MRGFLSWEGCHRAGEAGCGMQQHRGPGTEAPRREAGWASQTSAGEGATNCSLLPVACTLSHCSPPPCQAPRSSTTLASLRPHSETHSPEGQPHRGPVLLLLRGWCAHSQDLNSAWGMPESSPSPSVPQDPHLYPRTPICAPGPPSVPQEPHLCSRAPNKFYHRTRTQR